MKNEITVIIPSIGQKELIFRAVESLSQQLSLPDEVIIVNSGEQQLSVEDYPENLQKKMLIFNLPQKVNVSKARNFGVLHAKNNFVGFLDEDDEYSNTVVSSFRNEVVESSCYLYFPLFYKCSDGRFTRIKHPFFYKKSDFSRFLFSNPGIGGSNIIIAKRNFELVGGSDESLATSEDREIVMRLRYFGIHPKSLSKASSIVNIQENSLSRTGIFSGQLTFYKKHKNEYTYLLKAKMLKNLIKLYLVQLMKYS